MADRALAGEQRLARAPARRPLSVRRIFGRDWKIGYLFVLPMVVLMGGLIFWPFVSAIFTSFTAFNFTTGETFNVGIKNYQRLLSNSDYVFAMKNTISFTFWSLAIKFVVGMTIALVLNSRLPFRGLLTGIMLLPWIVPEIVTALAWRSIYDPLFGGLDPILQGLGLIKQPIGWLSEPNLAMGSVISVNIWKGIPFYVLLLLAGLKAVDREQLEAAEVDGANAVERFRHVTLPAMRYVIVVTLLLSFISTFNQFGLPFLMTGGGPAGATKLYSILAYEKAIGSLQYGPGIAIALSVAPLMAILIWLLARFMSPEDRNRSVDRRPSFGDQLARGASAVVGIIVDIGLLPATAVRWIAEKIAQGVRQLSGRAASVPILTRSGRASTALWLRLLVLLPFLSFVLFPFYWIIITSLKSTSQISARASIFWPQPATFEQYNTLV